MPVASGGDQTGRGELLEGRHRFRRGGPHGGFDAAPLPVPEHVHLRLRQPLEPPLGPEEEIQRGLECPQRPPQPVRGLGLVLGRHTASLAPTSAARFFRGSQRAVSGALIGKGKVLSFKARRPAAAGAAPDAGTGLPSSPAPRAARQPGRPRNNQTGTASPKCRRKRSAKRGNGRGTLRRPGRSVLRSSPCGPRGGYSAAFWKRCPPCSRWRICSSSGRSASSAVRRTARTSTALFWSSVSVYSRAKRCCSSTTGAGLARRNSSCAARRLVCTRPR